MVARLFQGDAADSTELSPRLAGRDWREVVLWGDR